MLFLGSAALLVGYVLTFAAVQGGRFIRNPLAGITEGSSGDTGTLGAANPKANRDAGRGIKDKRLAASETELSFDCSQDLAGYSIGKYSAHNFARRWVKHGCPGPAPMDGRVPDGYTLGPNRLI